LGRDAPTRAALRRKWTRNKFRVTVRLARRSGLPRCALWKSRRHPYALKSYRREHSLMKPSNQLDCCVPAGFFTMVLSIDETRHADLPWPVPIDRIRRRSVNKEYQKPPHWSFPLAANNRCPPFGLTGFEPSRKLAKRGLGGQPWVSKQSLSRHEGRMRPWA
jgi:hypothetical protein